MRAKIYRVSNRLSRVAGAVAVALLAACSATGYPIADLAAKINATLDKGALTAAAGDTIKLTFVDKVEWNQQVQVRPDGTATFLGLDSVAVVGMTAEQLDEMLSKRYGLFNTERPVERPLTVELSTRHGDGTGTGPTQERIFVIGEVRTPGPHPLTGRTMTLIEAIAAAGGHDKRTANLGNTILVRRLATGEMKQWRLDADVYDWGEVPPIYLQARDIVFVPNTAIDEVDIWVDQYIRQMLPFPYLVSPP